MTVRIIPRLEIKGPNLVKGIRFEGLRVMGKPEAFAKAYYEAGADEIIYVDAVASLYERNSLLDLVQRTARETFVPLTVAGGLRTIDDIRTVLRAGADKVALNTAAVRNPDLINEAARTFGSSTIVVSIEAIRHGDDRYEAYTDFGREESGKDAFAWAEEAVSRGAGELLVQSIDRDGTGQGFDLELTKRISSTVTVPVIAAGGAGSVDHVAEVVTGGAADAVSLSSLLHYHLIQTLPVDSDAFSDEGNINFLKTGRQINRLAPAGLVATKQTLLDAGIPVRPTQEVAA
ncbi:MAG: imidazole glycerol phosphate synthase subunit HisF [Magnetovibrionaceae bacterium]